jgi:hypothetical protein
MSEEDIIKFFLDQGYTREEAILAMASPTFPKPAFYTQDHELN